MTQLFDDPRITAMGLLAEAYTGLSPEHSLRMTDLASQTSLSTSGVTRVVDRLERGGLARRRACDSDRRISYTVITERGLARMNEVLPGHLELVERWFTGVLAPDELTAVLAGLRKVLDGVRPGATSGAECVVPPPRGVRAA